MAIPKFSDIKNWSVDIEKAITEEWKKNPFTFNPKTKKTIYSIDTPPPYVNAPIHMGHAVTYTYMDFFARYKRMTGHEVLFPLGLDRNGLPIETATEKKFNVSPFHMERDKFLELCEKLLSEASSESIDSFARIGISFSSYKKGKNMGDIYHTDAPEYRTLTQSTFIKLFKENLIYEDNRICNWDPKLRTTVADSEIDYKELQSTFNHVKFKVKETGKEIIIATTRPELIGACGMVIFEPGDKRYAELEGKTAITPIYSKEVSIMSHPFAKKDKGSGLVMMCAGGDVTDIQFFREQNLPATILVNKDGTMNEKAGILQGIKVRDARAKMIEELKKEKLLVKQDQIMHRTPISERSGAEIEFIEMPEFYLKQLDFKDDLREKINEMKFFPEESKDLLESWIDSVSIDWPISRRRFYATPIPLWHAGEYTAVPKEGTYYQAWKEEVPLDAEVFHKGSYVGKVKDTKFKKMSWKGDERVLDTWFDSSISELNIIQYPKNPKLFPISLRPQGKEIVRTWLYYTLLRSYLETKQKPFKEVWIHQHILDEKGRKMSKSLGNVVNPMDIINQEGAEAFRLWCAVEGDIAKGDLLCSRERIKAEQKTINKLLNVARFIKQFKKPKKTKLTKTDQAFTELLDNILVESKEQYEKYDFFKPAIKLKNFLWEEFASHYIELVKARAYNEEKQFTKAEQEAAISSLYEMFEKTILALHPIIPQITSVIAKEFDISLQEFPEVKKSKSDPSLIRDIVNFNKQVWQAKRDKNISLKESISGIEIPSSLRPFEKDLRAAHKLE